MLKPLSVEQIEKSQAQLRLVVASATEPPEVANREAVERASASGTFEYRGRNYYVPPISYLEGARLQQFGNTIGKLAARLETVEELAGAPEGSSAELEQLLHAFENALESIRRLCKPSGLWQRLLWSRSTKNPFADATVTEVGQLLGFFYQRRTTSSVRLGNWTPDRKSRR